MSTSDKTVEEMVESLNGFDEIAMERKFGADLEALQAKGTTLMRALCFVEYRRTGCNDADAYQAAMNLTLKQAQEFFVEDDEVMPDEPETEPGKDDSAPE